MSDETFVHSYLWRGWPADDPRPAAWQVILAKKVEIPGQEPRIFEGDALTPERAAAAGYPIERILGEIQHATAVRADRLEVSLREMTADRDAHAAAAESVRGELERISAFRDEADRRFDAASSENAMLRAQIKEAVRLLQETQARAEDLQKQLETATQKPDAEASAAASSAA